MIRKIIALFLGFLLLAVFIAPSIEAQNSLKDIFTEFYGLSQKEQPVMYLTTKQVKDLEQQLFQYREKLNNVDTQSEAEDIFREIINELNSYNLLGNLTVDEAFELVTCTNKHILPYQESNILSLLNINNDDFPENKQCLIYGNTDNTMFSSLRQVITGNVILTVMMVITLIAELNGDGIEVYLDEHPLIALVMGLSLNIWGLTMIIKNYVNPFCIADFIGIGTEEEAAKGNLFTIGVHGKKTWNESLYIDVTGFFGIKLVLDRKTDRFFYFGYASQVFEN